MEYIKNFTDHLVQQSWQIAVLFLIVAAGSFLLRNKSSHWRYLLWCVILAKCLLPPMITFEAAVLPFAIEEPRQSIDGANLQRESGVENRELNNQNSKMDSRLHGNDKGVGGANQPRYTMADYIKEHFYIFVFAVWGVGAAGFLIIAGVKAFLLNRWILRHRQLPSEDTLGEIEKLKSTVSNKFLSRIWVVEKITQPFVWGLWRGCVYLPAGSKNSADVIMHELAHIIRLDAFVNLLQIFAQAIFWFHPFVWIANNKIRAEREKSCDEIAIARLKVSPTSYSSAVVDVLVREYQARKVLPSLAVAGPVKNIEERIRTIMAQGKKFYSRPTAAAVITVLVLAVIFVPTTIALTKVGEPDFIIKGKVVDSATGKPIVGATVGDTERYNEGKFQTTTDANGDYSYKTWYEEHDIKSEADGYKQQDKGFGTKLFGSEKEKMINFELKPSLKTDIQIGAVEQENNKTGEIEKRQNVDVYIEDLKISPYEAGGLYTVTAKIGNRDTVTAPAFRMNFFRGDPKDNLNLHGKPQSGSYGAGPIKPGEFWNEQSSPFALREGLNELTVVLDINNSVAETNELNNSATIAIDMEGSRIADENLQKPVRQNRVDNETKGIKTARVLKITVYEGNNVEPDVSVNIPLVAMKIVRQLLPPKDKLQIIAHKIKLDENLPQDMNSVMLIDMLDEMLKKLDEGVESTTLLEVKNENERIKISLE